MLLQYPIILNKLTLCFQSWAFVGAEDMLAKVDSLRKANRDIDKERRSVNILHHRSIIIINESDVESQLYCRLM